MARNEKIEDRNRLEAARARLTTGSFQVLVPGAAGPRLASGSLQAAGQIPSWSRVVGMRDQDPLRADAVGTEEDRNNRTDFMRRMAEEFQLAEEIRTRAPDPGSVLNIDPGTEIDLNLCMKCYTAAMNNPELASLCSSCEQRNRGTPQMTITIPHSAVSASRQAQAVIIVHMDRSANQAGDNPDTGSDPYTSSWGPTGLQIQIPLQDRELMTEALKDAGVLDLPTPQPGEPTVTLLFREPKPAPFSSSAGSSMDV